MYPDLCLTTLERGLYARDSTCSLGVEFDVPKDEQAEAFDRVSVRLLAVARPCVVLGAIAGRRVVKEIDDAGITTERRTYPEIFVAATKTLSSKCNATCGVADPLHDARVVRSVMQVSTPRVWNLSLIHI